MAELRGTSPKQVLLRFSLKIEFCLMKKEKSFCYLKDIQGEKAQVAGGYGGGEIPRGWESSV